jgi:hypothetical protein
MAVLAVVEVQDRPRVEVAAAHPGTDIAGQRWQLIVLERGTQSCVPAGEFALGHAKPADPPFHNLRGRRSVAVGPTACHSVRGTFTHQMGSHRQEDVGRQHGQYLLARQCAGFQIGQ